MRCKDVKRLLSAYIDDELEPERHETVQTHLTECEGCSAELRELESAWSMLDTFPEVKAPPFFAARVMRRIHDRSQGKALRRRVVDFAGRAVLPAAVTAGILAGLMLGNRLNQALESGLQTSQSDPVIQEVGIALEDFAYLPSGSLSEAYVSLVASDNNQ